MDQKQFVDIAKVKFNAALDHFTEELKKIRTGRAHPSMLDGVVVKAYGTEMPLIQAGNITAPEAQLLQITPFDPNNLEAISDAIRNNQALGMNPMDDGRVVRVPVAQLTTERREQIAKQLGEKVEETMISLRNARHEALDAAKQAKNDKQISEDDYKRIEKQVEDSMADIKTKVDKQAETKKQEIMTV
jgi:ribosome recycling factor